MAYTSDNLIEIEKAISSGRLLVRIGDRTIQFQSLDDLRKARLEILAEISRGSSNRGVYSVADFSTDEHA